METTPAPIYWAQYKMYPRWTRVNGRMVENWVTGMQEFKTAEARDQFVKNTKYNVTATGER